MTTRSAAKAVADVQTQSQMEEHSKKKKRNEESQPQEKRTAGSTKVSIDWFPRPTQAGFQIGVLIPQLQHNKDLMEMEEIIVHFDGANRGNGLARKSDKNQKAAIGVVFIDEEGKWLTAWSSVVTQLTIATPDGKEHSIKIAGGNNRAEMAANIEALTAIIELKEKGAKFSRTTIVGDSAFTLESMMDHKNDGLFQLRQVQRHLLTRLKAMQVDVQEHRVDRMYNSNADEACNAALDDREMDRTVRPMPIGKIPSLDRFDTTELLKNIGLKRRRMWRALPADCRIQFHACVTLLLADAVAAKLDPTPWLILAPSIFLRTTERTHRKINALRRVLLMGQTSRQARVMLISHLVHGTDPNITHIFPTVEGRGRRRDESIRARVHGHVASRALGKALKEADGGRIAENDAAVRHEWLKTYAPWALSKEQPPKLPQALEGASQLIIGKEELFTAIRSLKPSASPGLTGWTRELMLGAHTSERLTDALLNCTNGIINDNVDKTIRTTMLTAPGIAFLQDKKVRTCGMRECFVKLAWRAALQHSSLDFLFTVAQMMGQRNGALRAARWVQEQLDDNLVVFLGDAINAHPSFDRHAARAMLQEHGLTQLFAIFNFTFANSTMLRAFSGDGLREFDVEIRVGQLQGCPSAGRIFCALVGYLITKYTQRLVPRMRLIMDDCAIVGRTMQEAEKNFDDLADALLHGGINIRGPKKKIVTTDSDALYIFGGAAVARKGNRFTSLEDVKPLNRLKKRVDFISTVGLAHQDWLLLTRHVSGALKYFIAATSPRITLHYAKEIRALILRPICQMLMVDGMPDHALRQTFSPIASGGLGITDPEMAAQIYDDADQTVEAGDDNTMKGKSYETMAVQKWRTVDKRGIHFWAALEMLDMKRSWLNVHPTSTALVLFDAAVDLTLRLYLNVGQQAPQCVNAKNTRASPEVQSIDHSIVCARCAAPWWKYRHDQGLAAMFATAQQFHVTMQADVAALLGDAVESVDAAATGSDAEHDGETQTTKKRPDGYIVLPKYGDQAGGASTVMFDYTVTHINALEKHIGTHPITRIRYHKVKKYERLLREVAMSFDGNDGTDDARVDVTLVPEVVPIVMTAFGLFDKASIGFFEKMAKMASRPGLTAAMAAAIQIRTMNAQASGVASAMWRLNSRIRSGQQVIVVGSDLKQGQSSAAGGVVSQASIL